MKRSVRATTDFALHRTVCGLNFLRVPCQNGIVALIKQLHGASTGNRCTTIHRHNSFRSPFAYFAKVLSKEGLFFGCQSSS
ncbi:hypothetical protein D3C79_902690 [compost metagenome]